MKKKKKSFEVEVECLKRKLSGFVSFSNEKIKKKKLKKKLIKAKSSSLFSHKTQR